MLGPHGPDEAEVWKASARTQAGLEKVRLKIVGPARAPGQRKPTWFARPWPIIPACSSSSPTGPADPALAAGRSSEARGQGIPVVLVGPAAGRGQVGHGDSRASRKTKSTASAGHQRRWSSWRRSHLPHRPSSWSPRRSAHAKHAELEPGKSAIIVVNTAGDSFIPERALAIKDALKAAGITTIEEVRFANDIKASRKSL